MNKRPTEIPQTGCLPLTAGEREPSGDNSLFKRSRDRHHCELEEKPRRRPACRLSARRNRSKALASAWREKLNQMFARGSCSFPTATLQKSPTNDRESLDVLRGFSRSCGEFETDGLQR